MTRALFPNLTFEYEIAGRDVPRPARRQCARWSHILRLIPGFEDAEPVSEYRPDLDSIAVWGMSGPARDVAGELAEDWPDPDVVREVNDKRFSHRLEVELGIELPGACLIGDLADLRRVSGSAGRWLAKHPFGVSGRERVNGEGPPGDEEHRAIRRLFESTSELVWEPRVERSDEWSLHYDVCPDAGVVERGATRLITDRHGVFRGNRAPAHDVPDAIIHGARRAVRRVAERGYRGPVGIDAFRGVFNGREVVRPLVEINARMSFGRLALILARRLEVDAVAWHHPARPGDDDLAPLDENYLAPGAWRLPEWCDPNGKSGSWIEILSDSFPAR